MTPLVAGEDVSKLPPSMEYIFWIPIMRDFVKDQVSIYSIDGNVTWRCGANGTRYALMGKTGSSCMLVRIQPLPYIAVYYNGYGGLAQRLGQSAYNGLKSVQLTHPPP